MKFTWDLLREYVAAHADGVTNKQISQVFQVSTGDASSLTKLMVSAGELRREERTDFSGPGKAYLYFSVK